VVSEEKQMKILLCDGVAKEGREILEKEKKFQVDVRDKLTHDELLGIIENYDAVVVRSASKITADVIDKGKKLKVIGRAGVGVDNIDIPKATEKGIVVMNTPGGNTISTAEQTTALIISLSRNIPQAVKSVKEGKWERKKFKGTELYEKTLGVIGLGRIGTEVIKRMRSFGMKIVAYDPFISKDRAESLGIELKELDDIFKNADYITVLSKMKKGVKIVNCARGGIVDEKDLYESIKSGHVGGAALDVYETEPPENSPLLELDNVITTPHLGASTEEAQVNVSVEMAQQIILALKDEIYRNALNTSCLDSEVLQKIKIYLDLGEKIGSMASQIAEGRPEKLNITYSGVLTNEDVEPINLSILKGFLAFHIKEGVNFVNAPVIAERRGLQVSTSKSNRRQDFSNLISVELITDKKSYLVAGSMLGKNDPRIVNIEGYFGYVVPKGHILICSLI
jgi:D-3-phosphoglycerate dehydrogenase